MVKISAKDKKVRKKKWFPIVSPNMFSQKVIGESLLFESEQALGRTVKVNLMSITNDLRNQNFNVRFQITGTDSGKLMSKIIDYEMIPAAVKRLVRRRQDRIDDSFVVKTSDGVRIRVKPMVLTRERTSNAIRKEMRKRIRQEVIKFVSSNTHDFIFENIVFYKVQNELKGKLSKVYPVKVCEIRILKDELNAKAKEAEAMAEAESAPVEDEKEDEQLEEEAAKILAQADREGKEDKAEDDLDLEIEIPEEPEEKPKRRGASKRKSE